MRYPQLGVNLVLLPNRFVSRPYDHTLSAIPAPICYLFRADELSNPCGRSANATGRPMPVRTSDGPKYKIQPQKTGKMT